MASEARQTSRFLRSVSGIVLCAVVFVGLFIAGTAVVRRLSPTANPQVVRPTVGPIASLRLPPGFAGRPPSFPGIYIEAEDDDGRALTIVIIQPGSGADLLLRQGDSVNVPWTVVVLNGQTLNTTALLPLNVTVPNW